jgi:hypothetical protein
VFKDNLATSYGITIPGFPNFFMIFGPQVPFANGPLVIDNTADWIGRTISYMKDHHVARIECKKEAAERWTNHVDDLFKATVVAQSAKDVGAWYVGANVESKLRKTLFYFGGIPAYINAVDKEIKDGYPGHVLSTPAKAQS